MAVYLPRLRLDEDGYPVRDENATTYVGAIETASACGQRIYAEAVRRGRNRARQVIVLGDGAAWIRGITEEHFPGAIQIVDLFHALRTPLSPGKNGLWIGLPQGPRMGRSPFERTG